MVLWSHPPESELNWDVRYKSICGNTYNSCLIYDRATFGRSISSVFSLFQPALNTGSHMAIEFEICAFYACAEWSSSFVITLRKSFFAWRKKNHHSNSNKNNDEAQKRFRNWVLALEMRRHCIDLRLLKQ